MQRRLDEAKMREQRALSAMAESDGELHAIHRQMAEKACVTLYVGIFQELRRSRVLVGILPVDLLLAVRLILYVS
jgi:hypothetical protein